MAQDQASVGSYELSIAELAKRHLYENDASEAANPVIKGQSIPRGFLTRHPRGWEAGACDADYSFHGGDAPVIHKEVQIQADGDVYHGLGNLANSNYDLSRQASVPTSQPPANPIAFPTAGISRDPPSSLQGEDKETTDVSSLTQLYLKTTESALKSSFEGLNASDITEPQRHGLLQEMISVLPSVPQIASVREALEGIVSTSTEVQAADAAIDSAPTKQSGAIAAATSEVQLLDDILNSTSNELLSMIEQQDKEEKLVDSLSAQLAAATLALHATREGVARLKITQSTKQSEAKKLRQNLEEISSQAAQEVEALKHKRSALMSEAGRLLEILKNWRPTTN